jgi:selenocysteine lyase/cysteine desulfurase
MQLDEFRSLFPITRHRAYLFSGAICPAAAPVRQALDEWAERWSQYPLDNYDQGPQEMDALRASFAGLIGADPDEVAITDGTSRGANIAIRLLAERSGSTVVVDDTTYPSSRYPWLTVGHKQLRYAPPRPGLGLTEAIEAQLDADTAAAAVAHVSPFTGHRHALAPLAERIHARGGLLLVDTAQSTGVVPIDVRREGIDVLVTTAMKWLLGPPGVGFLYIKREVLEGCPVGEVGLQSVVVDGEDYPPAELPAIVPGARALEPGLPSLSGLIAARVGIELIRAVGLPTIEERVAVLAGRCIEGLLERGLTVRTARAPQERAGVIAFDHAEAVALTGFLSRHGVDVGGLPSGLMRVDPHAFNTEDDIDSFLTHLDAYR